MFKKENLYRWLLALGYLAIFLPFIYSIFYSMPANDDFAWALEWWSTNRVVEMFHRIGWNYTNSFGNSGIFAIAIQVLFNPLYLFDNAGHSFGICMIIVNTIIIVGVLWATRTVFKYLFKLENQVVLDVITFLVALLVTTSYYYSDVYNWWSGTPGYSGMMMMCIISVAAMLRYQDDIASNKKYVAMIILGMITCTSMMYCVAIGSMYVTLSFIMGWKNGESVKRKTLPLVLYIISGILMAIAPGNYTRMSNENSAGNSLFNAIIVTAYRIYFRLKLTLQTKPWVVAIFAIIFVLGLYIGSQRKHNIFKIIFGYICVIVSAFSGLLLYVYGSAKTIDSEFTPRVYYVEDYMIFIGSAVAVFAIGAWVKQILKLQAKTSVMAAAACLCIMAGGVLSLKGGAYQQIIQYDIYQKSALIKESWYFWDDILNEVIAAEDGAEVVIDRDNVDWCQYSYYVSLDEIPRETLTEDAKYGNCNQCASKYYGVDSIIVNLY